jgi:GT2 family glycosyltransferase
MTESSVGVVVIGRNEGERLRACLASLGGAQARVYVDSGSTDGSTALARSLDFDVVELDMDQPFTAARARNTGIAWLLRHHPALAVVQTVDGDCEVRPEWLAVAQADMAADPRRAAVFGRRRERRPDANAYHAACDDEWNVPVGEVNSCGGDALLRIAALREVGGYNDLLIAGEEPEMCVRLRARGWRIWSNGQEMTLHDVAITRLPQWWHRARRTGYAFAELVALHGQAGDPGWRRLLRSALGWTAINVAGVAGVLLFPLLDDPLPCVIVLAPAALAGVQLARMARSKRARLGTRRALQWSGLMMVAKAAQTLGWLRFRLQRFTHARATLIEYKA